MKRMFTFILCLFAILCLAGCPTAVTKDMYAQSYTLLALPLSSKDMTTYYYLDEAQNNFFFLKPEYAQQSVNFNTQEASVRLLGKTLDYVEADWRYYETGRFFQNGYLYTIIMYNFPGEFGDPYLNVQLNGYKANGELLGALVLDTRYIFEDVEGFSEYIIEDNIVTISEYIGYFWDADNLEAGVVYKPVHQLLRVKTYKIADGCFTLLAEAEYPAAFVNKSRDAE